MKMFPEEEEENISFDVGWQFVQEYYTIMNSQPESLYKFYGNNSYFCFGYEGESAKYCHGKQEINSRFKELDFNDCKVVVSNVDSQASLDGGIIIQVLGEISNKNEPPNKYAQTFFLAKQPKGYYVLNDVFRYLKEEIKNDYENQEEENVETQEVQEENAETVDVEEKKTVDTEKKQQISESKNVKEVANVNIKNKNEKQDEKIEKKTENESKIKEKKIENEQKPSQKKTEAEGKSNSKEKKIENEAKLNQKEKKTDNESKVNPKEKKNANQAASSKTQNENQSAKQQKNAKSNSENNTDAKENSSKTDGPISYSSKLQSSSNNQTSSPIKSQANSTSPSTTNQNTTTTTNKPPVQPVSYSSIASSTKTWSKIAQSDVKPIVIKQTIANNQNNQKYNNNQDGNNSGNNNRNPNVNNPEKDSFTVFIKLPNSNIPKDEIAQALSGFGEIKHVEINTQKAFAFVEFATVEQARKAVSVGVFRINDMKIGIEERKRTNKNYLNNRMNNNYNNRDRRQDYRDGRNYSGGSRGSNDSNMGNRRNGGSSNGKRSYK